MKKIDIDFMICSFSEKNTVDHYKNAVLDIGLWKSERNVFTKYFNKDDKLLDIGCGAGRTTLGLYNLGYKNITGVDFIEDNIKNAKEIANNQNINIDYRTGNILKLEFDDNTFNHAIFSFNGFMQIPDRNNRLKALNELHRVLKPYGLFIFTSHDMRISPRFQEFWRNELQIWNENRQDKELIDFGDIIFPLQNRKMFMHFSTLEDQIQLLNQSKFEVIEHFDRKKRYRENNKVIKFAGDCRFWITKNVK